MRKEILYINSLFMFLLFGSALLPVQGQDTLGAQSLPVAAGKDLHFTALTDADPASNLKFTHLTTNDGLSQGHIYAILQDRQGFMWFATGDGLNRYDGNTFVVYKNNPNDPQSISADFIQDLLEDDHGFLWIATNAGGVDRFDPRTERFTRYQHNPDNPNSLSGDMVKCILQDRQGNLWFGTADDGLNKFDPATETFTHYRNDSDGKFVGTINSIIEDRQGDIWFTGTNGLYHMNPQTGKITRLPMTITADYLHEDQDGNLWLLAWTPVVGLIKYEPQTERLTQYPIGEGAAGIASSQILDDGQNGFWVASSLGLYHFDRQTGRYTYSFQHDETNPASLNDNRVVSIFQDRSGLLWVGTENEGLNLLNFRQKQFGAYQHDSANLNSLAPGSVTAIYEDTDGIVWVGYSPRALDRLDRKTGQITHYIPDPANENSLGGGYDLNSIYKDSRGYLWLGGWGSGLVRFDERGGQFKHYPFNVNDPNSLPTDAILSIHEDRSGRLWVGHIMGLSLYDPTKEQFTTYRPDPTNPSSAKNCIRIIYQDHSGALWLATWGGVLSRFDDQTNNFVNYTPDSRDPHRLHGGGIFAIYEDQAGTLWVGGSDGLYRFNRENETFTRYTESQGLPSSNIQGILGDGAGRLWLSTSNGLSRFDPQTETFRNYDISNGLQDNDFSQSSYAQGQKGELFFGGSNGFNAFFPENIQDNPYVPPVVVTNFKIFNKPVPINADSVLKQAPSYIEALTLPYQDNVFSFEFTALSYASSWKNRYRYKLDGLETSWNEVDSKQRLAIYTNLDPGNYVFRVQASNNDGVWNEQGTAINITITPPWWGTWWFRGAALIALLALFFSAYRLRVRSIVRYNQELQHQVAERTALLEAANKELEAFAYSVSHDLRAPLRHIDGFIELLQKRTTATLDEKSQHYMATISESAKRMDMLIDDLLSFSRMGRNEMSKAQVDLGELVQDAIREFKPEVEGRDIQWKISPLPVVIGDRAMLRVVLVNLISNALKFTRPREQAEIEIGEMPVSEKEIAVFIHDNGVGFDKQYADRLFGVFQRLHRADEFEGTGIGLANVRRVISRHGGRTWAEGEIGHGATFYFSLPQPKER